MNGRLVSLAGDKRMQSDFTTGVVRGGGFLSWAVLRDRSDGPELVDSGSVPDTGMEALVVSRERLRGTVVGAAGSELLFMRVLRLPGTEDPVELKAMAELRMERFSPFPPGQMVFAVEQLSAGAQEARVLAVGIRRDRLEALGEEFRRAGLRLHSLDAEVLGWYYLLKRVAAVPEVPSALLLRTGAHRFDLLLTEGAVPVALRTLDGEPDSTRECVAAGLAEELEYTLTTLEQETGLLQIEQIELWLMDGDAEELGEALAVRTGLPVQTRCLRELPPLAEGIARRFAERGSRHIELIPSEWIEAERRRKAVRWALFCAGGVLAGWLVFLLMAGVVFQFRSVGMNRLRERAAALSGPAEQVQQVRRSALELESYADHSRSALECLREVSVLLPPGLDLESFNYRKGAELMLRGSGPSDEAVYRFFDVLAGSALFSEIKNQRVTSSVEHGVRKSRFSLSASLQKEAAP